MTVNRKIYRLHCHRGSEGHQCWREMRIICTPGQDLMPTPRCSDARYRCGHMRTCPNPRRAIQWEKHCRVSEALPQAVPKRSIACSCCCMAYAGLTCEIQSKRVSPRSAFRSRMKYAKRHCAHVSSTATMPCYGPDASASTFS